MASALIELSPQTVNRQMFKRLGDLIDAALLGNRALLQFRLKTAEGPPDDWIRKLTCQVFDTDRGLNAQAALRPVRKDGKYLTLSAEALKPAPNLPPDGIDAPNLFVVLKCPNGDEHCRNVPARKPAPRRA